MGSFHTILNKLEAFSKRHYTKLLIKGVLLFLTFGLLLFLMVTGAEFVLWLPNTARLILFFGFLLSLIWLIYRYLFVPIGYLVKLRKGITHKDASKLIGKHFPEVGDKLFNLLELAENPKQSDLLLAAIEQRSEEMQPVAFIEAVSLRESLRYSRLLLIPVGIVLLIWLSGSIADFFNSYNRVVNYDVAYEPPAPFRFVLENENFTVLEDRALTIKMGTIGDVKPEEVMIAANGELLLMKEENGAYQYTFQPPFENFSFHFDANGVVSRTYHIEVIKVPAISGFEMFLKYPGYLNLNDKKVTGTGNAAVPEGTQIEWKLKGVHTSAIHFITQDTVENFNRSNDDGFSHKRTLLNDIQYELTTSNENIENYERLGYRIQVIKDGMPSIQVEQQLDSLMPNESYYNGLVSDDYGLSRIRLVYYEQDRSDTANKLELLKPTSNVEQFYYTFPSGLSIAPGKTYELYFEVMDNDGLRNGKVARSQLFTTAFLNDKELKNNELNTQRSLLNEFGKSVGQLKEQEEMLKEINQRQKQNTNLDYNDKQQIQSFLEKQKQQESLMEKFSKELRKNITDSEKDLELSNMLKERLERQELLAKKNQKLLEELNKIADKIEKEDLKKRLEELAKSQNSGKRSLEQLLELTKRYYVTEKAAQLADKLDELSSKQDALSKHDLGQELSDSEQKKLNEEFDGVAEELEELKKDNADLKKPLGLDIYKEESEDIKSDQKDALEEIKKHLEMDESSEGTKKEESANRAAQKQKSAAEKMKNLSEKLQSGASSSSGGSSIAEDAEMLRQILDNLVSFSFKQENLFEDIEEADAEINRFSRVIRDQKELRLLFEHVDDSLFALSLRRAELSDFVNEQITEVYYNIDRSLESIAENQLYQGASYQQYVLTASNSLADFLAKLLDNMQQSMMSGQGQGQGDDQLPDIIKSQSELREKMNSSSQQNGSSEQSGQEGGGRQEGEKGDSEGENGEPVNQGQESQQGKGSEGEGDEKGGRAKEGSSSGNGDGQLSEQQLKEIYEIYQEQEVIRKKLEEQLNDIIDSEKRDLAKKLVLQMQQFENELLQNGITERTVQRINAIQHQMLKLENAALKQGKQKKRESNSNKKDFSAPILTKPKLLKEHKSDIEILSRQALPLRRNYQNKVKEYFSGDN